MSISNIVILIFGFFVLIKSADFFVESAVAIAKYFKVPIMIIALTIVALGTSFPEGAICIASALRSSPDMAIGTIIGSCLFNLTVIMGLAAVINPIKITRTIMLKEFPYLIMATTIFVLLSADKLFMSSAANSLSRTEGIVLLLVFSMFLYYLIQLGSQVKNESMLSEDLKEDVVLHEEDINLVEISIPSIRITFLAGLAGLLGIFIGSELVTESSIVLATDLGVSKSLIGLTVVAIGTSLPELVTSLTAMNKGESELALGNIIGSNMINMSFILGVTAVIHPLVIDSKIVYDAVFLLFTTVVAYLLSARDRELSKNNGLVLLALYLIYIGFSIYMG